jgi:hypothetical protein
MRVTLRADDPIGEAEAEKLLGLIIQRRPRKRSFKETAWWARQDSNLQPDRYEQ